MNTAWPTHPSRRQALAWLALAGAAERVHAAAKTLPASRSLQTELARALGTGQPLVVMVSLHGCPWCKLVREHYLAPMHAEEGLPVVQVDMGSKEVTHNVAGERITHDALIRGWRISVAPTVLFLGRDGREVVERLEGGSPDFYSGYLDDRLERARRALTR